MKRRTFIQNSGLALGSLTVAPVLNFNTGADDSKFPLTDLHVHLTNQFTIDHVMDIAKRTGVQFGIVEHPAPWAIKNDDDLKQYIERLRPYPVYIGLQPIDLGWAKNFSKELLDQLDYILMDPQRVPMGDGNTWFIWNFDTYVPNTEEFMKRYMDYSMKVLEEEPLTIFAWPLFLPVCISRDYYTLWTEERMKMILDAAKKRNIAIEINDMAHTPHEEFINTAKAQGLKFTFGSDARNTIAGRLAYCKRTAEKCNLTSEDFFIPQRTVG